jgi:hypothetical protein
MISHMSNQYGGYLVDGQPIDRIDCSIDAHSFYEYVVMKSVLNHCSKYVAPRRPCILTGTLPGSNFQAWTLDYLKEKAGNVIISVEHRESANHRFGLPLGSHFAHLQVAVGY